jgi:hypothetical protein
MNDATQAEKRKVLLNDTYHSRATVDADAPGGRFKASNKTPVSPTEYPAAAGPWSDPVEPGIEPPLGYSVDEVEPVGEYHEIQASLAATACAPEESCVDPSLSPVAAIPSDAADPSPSSSPGEAGTAALTNPDAAVPNPSTSKARSS